MSCPKAHDQPPFETGLKQAQDKRLRAIAAFRLGKLIMAGAELTRRRVLSYCNIMRI
jgi:hypothetical protein